MSTTPGEAFGLPRHADPQTPVDETPELDPTTFDLNAWVAGVTSTVRAVTLYQRPDLLADVDELERQIGIAKKATGSVPDGEDELGGSDDVQTLQERLADVLKAWAASAMTFRVQGRTDEWRDAAKKRLRKQGITDETEIILRSLAESIIAPAGITYEHLAHLNEVSQPQVKMLLVAWGMANNQPPAVNVPFSPASSPKPAGRRSS
jgi:hypothetical protein